MIGLFSLCVAALCACQVAVVGFPNGAPIEACIYNNFPNHPGSKAQPIKTSDYKVTASSASFYPGSTIKVEVSGPPFKGFFVQARLGSKHGKWIGSFKEGKYVKQYPECSSATHTENKLKKYASVIWEAPFKHVKEGKIYFLVTVLQNYDRYWPNILAEPLRF